MDKPAMASVFRMRHAPASILGVRSLGRGQADPIFHSRPLGEAIRFVAEADGLYDLSAVAISYGDRSTPPLGSREVRQLWTEYGQRLIEA
ncbi:MULTISPECIES: hypothetical protein [unclassified Mesorhizobium]|uniref:hypothetical protein n=1 Tax=unclassified Mesorhizobium TaxID=325217 RepID=UPI000FCA8F3B|nr:MULTISPECIES: hypothetical protein [unclassified Mesorhizobium]TGP17962.1 hypothetical protein EN874_031585 [Mesorhizobium sp. M1D.F.Ca.ET.231.01.1.1]TGP24608.1 hypothetical protein EN877_31125 [Mesorhizobium sp. M1D.F.Ca.ET.234.01.1.1]TGS36907.1 hypothetical protein EN827_31585 [Mesorhizobium sp. M1D.F.Ca.ET.184.01.1.1]TGS57977.1 hypothetical protein EN826_031555 [Mesorhizobium sp. M1D.F.Ca.ET.183.01.1.1]